MTAHPTAESRFRLVPMTPRDPHESGRSASTLELFFDLVFVVARQGSLPAVAHGPAASRGHLRPALAAGPRTAGELAETVTLARPGVSRHLRVLREAGLVDVEHRAQHRIYSLHPDAFAGAEEWLARHRALWSQRLDALHTEVARGRRGDRGADSVPPIDETRTSS